MTGQPQSSSNVATRAHPATADGHGRERVASRLNAQLLAKLSDQIHRENRVNRDVVNLVASENRLSPVAALPLQSDFYNRYFFNTTLDRDAWHFRGGEAVGAAEVELTIPTLGRLGCAPQVNVRPVSGMGAMMLVLLALGGLPGDTVVSIAQDTGGHYATNAVISRIGRKAITVTQSGGVIDEAELRAVLATHRPKLVYLDLQNSLFEIDVASVVHIVRETNPDTRVHVDVSHTLGLVLGGAHANPLDLGADSMGGSTHKSYPGPQKGVVFTRDRVIADLLAAAQFDTISSHHFAETLSLGMSALEFEIFGTEYAARVVANARALGRSLLDRGFDVVSGPSQVTDTHQVWMGQSDDHAVAELMSGLAAAGVRANAVTLPGFGGRMALRLGVAEITFEGGHADSMATLANIFSAVRSGQPDKARRLRIELREHIGPPFFLTGEPA